MKTIFILSAFILLGINSIAQNMFIAHRGASNLAPENTIASANLAWELGADAVEVDVYLSQDNRVMVIHDKNTKRTCSGKKTFEIEKTPSVLLRDQDAGSWKGEEFKGEKIPFIEEIIETVPEGKTLVIEIKCGPEVLPELQRAIDKKGKANQIAFIGFDYDTMVQAHAAFPNNKCYWLSSTKPGDKKLDEVAAAGLTGINIQHKAIDEELIAAASKRNLEVLTWTVDDPAEAKRLTEIGVKGLTTNRPKWLKEEMSKL
ncbi:MAG TPA: glycerophosphodiester phosphodiesterase family protein [Draconibacterium sp.]|nr:glycerophosphodiester phosphodiesterase family protein [Draconibacterium sp.]